jgi:ELWxxDGT repeat protein
MKRSRLLISVALGLFASGLLAQSTPVVDIYPGSPGSSPDWGTPLWNRLVVEANNGQSGPSPCIVSPRQQSATLLLSRQGGGHAMWLCRIGNEVLYESDYDQASGSELWITDGTKTGTRLLKDINPGPASSSPHWMTRWRDRVFFRADDGIHGAELWVTDGTAAGTRMLRDINPGGVLGSDSDPGGFTVMGDRIFFSANDGVHGLELWASDGTSAGTKMIVDLSPGFTFSAPRDLEAHDGKLYFVAMNFSTGTELYVSDGTAAGTLLLKDIYPGSGSSGVSNLTSWNGRLWFSAMDSDTRGRELWASDGTNAGTRLFMDIRPELFASGDPRCFSPVGSRYLYFSATDGTKGHELWRTDGTVAGTKMVDEILKGPAGSSPSMRSEGSESRFPVNLG